MLAEGEAAPDFRLPSTSGDAVRLSDHADRPVVLYFYPEDGTVGCTLQARLFRAYFSSLSLHSVALLGVSQDSIGSHCAFQEKLDLPFELLSDEDGSVHDAYGAWKQPLFGSDRRPRRCTYLIAPGGTIAKAYPRVNVATHARSVVQDLEALGHQQGWLEAH